MIVYLIKVVLCSFLFLAIYYALLEKSKTYRFNRFYLLGSVVFPLIIPLVTIELSGESTLTSSLPVVISNSTALEPAISLSDEPVINWWAVITIGCYTLVLATLLYRFIVGLIKMRMRVKNSEMIIQESVRFIILTQPVTPHTFLKYIFLNKEDLETVRF